MTPRDRAIHLAKELVEGGKIYPPADYLANLGREFLKVVEWQPIETAPKDGTEVLGYSRAHDVCSVVRWNVKQQPDEADGDDGKPCWRENWDLAPMYNITHWKPLDGPPQ